MSSVVSAPLLDVKKNNPPKNQEKVIGTLVILLMKDVNEKAGKCHHLLQQLEVKEAKDSIFNVLKDSKQDRLGEKNVERRAILFLLCRLGELLKYFDNRKNELQALEIGQVLDEQKKAQALELCHRVYGVGGELLTGLRDEIIHHFRYEEALASKEGPDLSRILSESFPHLNNMKKPDFPSRKHTIALLKTRLSDLIQMINTTEDEAKSFRCAYLPDRSGPKHEHFNYFTKAGVNFRALQAHTLSVEIKKLNEQLEQSCPAVDEAKLIFQMAALNRLMHTCSLVRDLEQDLPVSLKLDRMMDAKDLKGVAVIKTGHTPVGGEVAIFKALTAMAQQLDHSHKKEIRVQFNELVLGSKSKGNIDKLLKVVTVILRLEAQTYGLCQHIFQQLALEEGRLVVSASSSALNSALPAAPVVSALPLPAAVPGAGVPIILSSIDPVSSASLISMSSPVSSIGLLGGSASSSTSSLGPSSSSASPSLTLSAALSHSAGSHFS